MKRDSSKMKPVNPGSHRQKIIMYYTLAVVLPGIILGYMAYRGIRNDQALREKENLKKLEVNSLDFFAEIDSGFVRLMTGYATDKTSSYYSQGYPSVIALYVTGPTGSKKLISHQLLYLPTELITRQPEQTLLSSGLNEGIHLEFVERNFPEALRFYQDKALRAIDTAVKIQALVASARLYNRMNKPERAKALYYEICKDYPGRLLNGQIPLGLTAGLEIMKINRALGENDEMRNNARRSLELLLHPPCEYDVDQFDLFYDSFSEIINETDPVIDSLFREIDTQRARTEYLTSMITEPDRDLTDRTNSINAMVVKPVNTAELAAVSLSWNNKDGTQTSMVIDFPVFLHSNSEKLISKLDIDSSLKVKIEDNNGMLILIRGIDDAETAWISFTFPENLPRFRLFLSENKPGFLTTLLKAGSGLYLFIFILIALLMVLGFVFTLYTLNVELRLNKLKSEFISNVSHELKSPLTSIRMMTEMLHHNRVETEERKSAYYSAMLEESEHLSHLIDNILDFSRMDDERKKYDFKDLDMDELLVKFLESTRQRLPASGFDIRYSCPDRVPAIQADRDAMLQVFYNLIDNAIKFSGSSRQIDVSLSSGDEELQFCVKDYGIGISPKDQVRIFDRFYRSDEIQKQGIRGSGIGLTIVRKIIEAHYGHLTLESKPGAGSTFCVHLPLNKKTEQ
jgi:signal transduction histidine kinase